MAYTPPTPDDLQALKADLGYTGKQMAALACVGEQHWRKYTGGADPKEMPYPNLFHLAAQLALAPADLDRVVEKMREIGAEVDGVPGARVERLVHRANGRQAFAEGKAHDAAAFLESDRAAAYAWLAGWYEAAAEAEAVNT